MFGTDGIRGIVGKYPLDRESVIKLGRCLGELWNGKRVLLGRDTRESGEDILAQLAVGLGEMNDLYDSGVIPTPGLSYVIDQGDYDCGLMITASHNPYKYNGIKLFQSNGEKTSRKFEKQIEKKFFSLSFLEGVESRTRQTHHIKQVHCQSAEIYKKFLIRCAGELDLSGMKIILDCAHGATYRLAPDIFRILNPNTQVVNNRPDGRNVNDKCGSTDLEELKKSVLKNRADLGIAFDGDGDRVMFIDNDGFILDGDYTLFLISQYLKINNDLSSNLVVGTIMSNLGLEEALAGKGIRLVRTDVGDRNVYLKMAEKKTELGGEKSGHVILKKFQKTGDGILTALFFLKSLTRFQLKPEQLKKQFVPFVQESRNIVIREKRDLQDWLELNRLLTGFNHEYGRHSRVIVRYSGTEPVLRVMMESKHQDVIDKNLDSFVDLIESSIGEKHETGS